MAAEEGAEAEEEEGAEAEVEGVDGRGVADVSEPWVTSKEGAVSDASKD